MIQKISAYGGSFIFGISLGWASPAAPQILSDDFNLAVSKTEFAWIVGLMALGASIATAIAGVLRNKFGTKLTIVIIGFPTTIGWLLLIFAKFAWMVKIDY